MKKNKKKNDISKNNLLTQNQSLITKKIIKNEKNQSPKIIKSKNTKQKNNLSKCLLFLFIIENIIIFIFLLRYYLQKLNFFSSKKKFKILPREKALNSGLIFIKKCSEGILIKNKTKKEKIKNPKITAIIPCYNCFNDVKSSVRSIQNQNMFDVEIIIVNDNSNDESQKILNELKNEDPRIEIINNNQSMNNFYSINIGVLNARGKYVIILDQGDMFLDKDVFETLYYSAEEGNYDIISFKLFDSFDYSNRNKIKEIKFNYKINNLTIFQPELSCYIISQKNEIKKNDIYIFGKLYRTSMFKSAINILGEKIISINLIFGENSIMLFVISNVASSYKFINKYGLMHIINKNSNLNKLNYNDKIFAQLIKINIELFFTKKECGNIPALEMIQDHDEYKRVNDNRTIFYLKNIVKKILYSDKIEEKYKDEIIKLYGDYLPKSENNN